VIRCPSCGEENPERFRLCGFCGTALAPAAPPQENRRTVTIVFSDLKGSTSLGERLDGEALREVLTVYFTEMRAVLERHGGVVEKYIGDAIMAVFGIPRAHEDDALRAVRAADEMRGALVRVNERLATSHGVRLENRTGVNTGVVVAGDVTAGQRLVTGDAVNVAARLEQAAPATEVLIGEPTYRLVRDAVEVEVMQPLELKGKAERIPAYRLIGVTSDEGYARRIDLPIVGRERELETLIGAFDDVEEHAACRLVTIVAPAGTGKSRLVRAVIDRLRGRAAAVLGRCLPYGEGITYWPIGEIARELAGVHADDSAAIALTKLAARFPGEAEMVARVAGAIGLEETPHGRDETFWAIGRMFEVLAADRPLVVVIDDIHWAEATLLELLAHLCGSLAAPVLVLCTTRTELDEDHPGWIASTGASSIALAPLERTHTDALVANLLGGDVDPIAVDRIAAAAQGNPLYVEQLISMMVDDSLVARRGDRWTLTDPSAELSVPPTISALLTARLDRLGAVDRAVTERAAVIGQRFERLPLEHLVPAEVRPYTGTSLVSLTDKALIEPAEEDVGWGDAYRFSHVLIRDAAYETMLRRTGAELHEAFVDWVEEQSPDRAIEFEEIRGYHLEQAFLIRRDLGSEDPAAIRSLGDRAAAYLRSAGRRALARGDMPAAGNLLARASMLMDEDNVERAQVMIDAAECLAEAGELARATEIAARADEVAASHGDEVLQLTARVVRDRVRLATEGAREDELLETLDEAIPALERLGAHASLARAWRLATQIYWQAGRWGEAEAAARRMIDHAHAAGDPTLGERMTASIAICLLYGPTPVPEAIARCEELLASAAGDRKAEALVSISLAHLVAMRGDLERARTLARSSRARLEELGWRFLAALSSIDSAPIEILAGDLAAAERELRRDYETLDAMGERNYIATVGAMLADVLVRQGRLDEAETLTKESETTAAPDDVASQVLWRTARAKVAARAGRSNEARTLAEEAVELQRGSDEPDGLGNALLDQAEVMELIGQRDRAIAAVSEALVLFEAKGNLVSLGAARRHLAELG
jgi:class 3 adenylate cyclase/tetratricopeptide (TPR) repeat protein